jgi:hypothetical protein
MFTWSEKNDAVRFEFPINFDRDANSLNRLVNPKFYCSFELHTYFYT